MGLICPRNELVNIEFIVMDCFLTFAKSVIHLHELVVSFVHKLAYFLNIFVHVFHNLVLGLLDFSA